MSRMKKVGITIVAVVAVIAIGAGIATWKVAQFLDTPVQVPEGGAVFEIPAGSSFRAVAARLGRC